MASRVLHDSHLRSAIEKEVNPLCATTSPTTCPELFQKKLERCPILTATYYETLRTVTSSISAREVVSECTIGSLRFQADTRVIIPSRQTLIDDSIFGANAKSFDINRFLKNPRLIKSPSFRPFGGGISYCPGRFMAMKEAMSFTVLVLRNFDVKPLDAKLEYPRIDTAKPCLGIMDVVHDEDLLLRVRRKII
jgi:cytochrome P450